MQAFDDVKAVNRMDDQGMLQISPMQVSQVYGNSK